MLFIKSLRYVILQSITFTTGSSGLCKYISCFFFYFVCLLLEVMGDQMRTWQRSASSNQKIVSFKIILFIHLLIY